MPHGISFLRKTKNRENAAASSLRSKRSRRDGYHPIQRVAFLKIRFISKLVDRIFSKKKAKGPKGKEDCAASIGGKSAWHKDPPGVPQKAAEAGKESFGEITEPSATGKKRVAP
jgi:hypothetical protein